MVEELTRNGIESNRKGFFRLNFRNKDGEKISGANVTAKQKNHEFKFGANIFKYGCFDKDEENAKYEEYFKKLFNMATAAIYWDAFEPEDGKMRFSAESPFVDRRPPVDGVYEFCQKNGIAMKFHPLFWPVMIPTWLPDDSKEVRHLLIRRMIEISERYDGKLCAMDVVNEVTSVPLYDYETFNDDEHYRAFKPLDPDYAFDAFRLADRYFPETKLVLNETGGSWYNVDKKLNHPYRLFIQNMLMRGARVDEIGLQYHMFFSENDYEKNANEIVNPTKLFKSMEIYNTYNKPLSVSEVTIIGKDEDVQAKLFENLYKIWFSYRNMDSIIYWNIGDNCAISEKNVKNRKKGSWNETQFKSGLFRDDFTKKPAFDVLDNLINHEWMSQVEKETSDDHVYINGFYGDYDVTVIADGKKTERKVHFSKNGFDEFNVVI